MIFQKQFPTLLFSIAKCWGIQLFEKVGVECIPTHPLGYLHNQILGICSRLVNPRIAHIGWGILSTTQFGIFNIHGKFIHSLKFEGRFEVMLKALADLPVLSPSQNLGLFEDRLLGQHTILLTGHTFILLLLYYCYTIVILLCPSMGYLGGIPSCSPVIHTLVILLSYYCYTIVTLLSYSSHTIVILLLYYCNTNVILLCPSLSDTPSYPLVSCHTTVILL